MGSYYITTPIFYVNDVPHLGHAYATIAADALARFHRAAGDDTYFLTGTDEHGQKIEQEAARRGQRPAELADGIVDRFRATWKRLEIANDDFIRTTEERHERVVSDMWHRIAARGDIYESRYEGHYCVACEGFYPDNQLLPGNRCPIHGSEVSWLAEPSYFFRLSKYAQPLLDHIAANPDFVRPEGYRNEVVSFVSSGLRDLSVSRTTFTWGVPVPGVPGHIIYVWIDALSNYVSALGGPDGKLYQRYWPASCHLIGKDILRFHAVYWPCMLMSAGLPLPRTIFTTGFWTVRGSKISKSLPATRVDPNQLAEDLGVDALRYFLLREIPLGADGDFSYEGLIGRYNADLANDLGNLASRTLAMADTLCGGKVPPASPALASTAPHDLLASTASKAISESARLYGDYALSRALEAIWVLVREANRYIDTCQPWKLARELAKMPAGAPDEDRAARQAELDHTMRSALEALACVARAVAPVMPGKAAEILGRLGLEGEERAEALGRLPGEGDFGRVLVEGALVERGEALFPRIDSAREKAMLAAWIGKSVQSSPDRARASSDSGDGGDSGDAGAAKASAPAAGSGDSKARKGSEARKGGSTSGPTGLVTFDEFARFDLRVAVIRAAEPVPRTKKLLRVELDVGDGQTRQVVAGIAEAYAPEALIGRKVVFLANLEPATIRGVRSEGMILAAGDETILGLLAVDPDVPAGTRIR